MSWPAVPWSDLPSVSSAVLREADHNASKQFGIEPLQLMEIAGWQVARFADDYLNGVQGKFVVVVAGSGNNGGDALVAARMLWQRGAKVTASVVPARDQDSLVARHTRTIRELGIRVETAPRGIDAGADMIIDGLLGTGVRPPLRAPAPEVIRAMNAAASPIVAVDVPSGMDADTGAGAEDAVRAAATITLAAPKTGLSMASNAGRVFVADIGMPAALFRADRSGIEALYRIGPLVELTGPRNPLTLTSDTTAS